MNTQPSLKERQKHRILPYVDDLFRLSLENPVRMCSILSSSLLALHRLHLHFYTRSLLCAHIYIYIYIYTRVSSFVSTPLRTVERLHHRDRRRPLLSSSHAILL